jgi:hypothetical protein
MCATINISGLWIMICDSWQHTALSWGSYSLDWRRDWISRCRAFSLSWNWLILTTIIFHVFLKFLFCELNLILDIVMSFVDVSYLLEPFNFFTIFFNHWIPSIPVDYMKTGRRTKVHRVNLCGLLVKYLPLYVFTHVLYYGSLSIHGCRLLCFSLWPQLIKTAILYVVSSWVFSRLLLHLIQVNTRYLV